MTIVGVLDSLALSRCDSLSTTELLFGRDDCADFEDSNETEEGEVLILLENLKMDMVSAMRRWVYIFFFFGSVSDVSGLVLFKS